VGHGCSINYEKNDGKFVVATEYIPVCDTPDVEAVPRNKDKIVEQDGQFVPAPYIDNNKILEFKWLSNLSDVEDIEVINGIKEFIDTYGAWIDAKQAHYASAPDSVKKIAVQELGKCKSDRDILLYQHKAALVETWQCQTCY
jgi:hypothetical protein